MMAASTTTTRRVGDGRGDRACHGPSLVESTTIVSRRNSCCLLLPDSGNAHRRHHRGPGVSTAIEALGASDRARRIAAVLAVNRS